MNGDGAACIMGGSHTRGHLRQRQRRTSRLARSERRIRVEFQQIGAAPDLLADRPDHLVSSRDLLRPLWDGDARFEAFRTVGIAGDDRLGREQDQDDHAH